MVGLIFLLDSQDLLYYQWKINISKSVLVPTGLMAAADAAIQKKIFGSWMTTLIFSNEELEDIMEAFKSLEDAGLLIKGVGETIKNRAKEWKSISLAVFLGALAASLLGNI